MNILFLKDYAIADNFRKERAQLVAEKKKAYAAKESEKLNDFDNKIVAKN